MWFQKLEWQLLNKIAKKAKCKGHAQSHPRKPVPGENESYTDVLAKKRQYAHYKFKILSQINKINSSDNKPLGFHG